MAGVLDSVVTDGRPHGLLEADRDAFLAEISVLYGTNDEGGQSNKDKRVINSFQQ